MKNLKYFIIDTTSPFFMEFKYDKVNWSKVPFCALERKGKVHKKTHKIIRKNFIEYVNKVKALGYNALSLDDLSHITMFRFYPEIIRRKVRKYRKKFKKLFQLAADLDMKIFLTSDVMFSNYYIRSFTKNTFANKIRLLKYAVEKAFIKFPRINGIIFRIGESDGQDVECDFKSELILKTPQQVNTLLKLLLPVFEKYNKFLILRTWTTGAYKIGDLMWNINTFKQAFQSINSSCFILSLKYGEADFFRFLPLSRFFADKKFKKIIELQTRREYEGFGEYPAFVGWDYYNYYQQLKSNETIVGIHVWCQTGGWSSFKNFSYLKPSSDWNELNTQVTLDIYKNKICVEESVARMQRIKYSVQMLEFLKLSDQAIKGLLYDPGMQYNSFFFNKLRIPPQIHIFWDNVTLTNLVILYYRIFNKNPDLSLQRGYKALFLIRKMESIAQKYQISYKAEFHFATFRMFYLIRQIIYQGISKKRLLRLYNNIEEYNKKFKTGYKFYIQINKRSRPVFFRFVFKFLIRKKCTYRLIDKILFSPFFSRVILMLLFFFRKNFPEFTGNQAMPISTFFE